MADLTILNDKVSVAVAEHDGSWQKRQQMLNAIEELRIAALGPADYVAGLRYQALQNMGIAMVLEMNLLTPIVDRHGAQITADEVAEASGSDKSLTVRLLRLLSSLHLITELSAGIYRSNANTVYLSHKSRTGAHKFLNIPTLNVMANAVPYMRAHGGRFPQFPDKEKGEKGLAEWTHGMSLWELFRAQPEVLRDFSDYLGGRREDMVGYWFDIWPTKEKIGRGMNAMAPENDGQVLVVDVGGNVGYDLQAFRKRFPEFVGRGRLNLQDLRENIEKAEILLEGTGIEAMEYDFFNAQPIKGASIYYFGGIFHDWSDAQALSILRNVAAAMSPVSRIIIDEMPLPDEKASLSLVQYDLLMMINVNGIERTFGHYRELLSQAGLEIVDVWRTQLDTVLEVKLVA
ncbi:Demethylsterigmatocystin 6-O-methyltransferase [Cyphellophora attinorum]|uniref:Demethylsterigmatocystin 6-O-methyltransferase n=1 Tax=Cyphellophora attinorum TaxID=1664694 RepID=A0A0N1H4W7_9EURO|nr:Demethylsterigmatocystin 6-O-methyltransferase [Phialophora attinorum]KPI40484.1 Demethylsterigmatocystin 6-O-methyltransferase [Phialophora attinorum]